MGGKACFTSSRARRERGNVRTLPRRRVARCTQTKSPKETSSGRWVRARRAGSLPSVARVRTGVRSMGWEEEEEEGVLRFLVSFPAADFFVGGLGDSFLPLPLGASSFFCFFSCCFVCGRGWWVGELVVWVGGVVLPTHTTPTFFAGGGGLVCFLALAPALPLPFFLVAVAAAAFFFFFVSGAIGALPCVCVWRGGKEVEDQLCRLWGAGENEGMQQQRMRRRVQRGKGRTRATQGAQEDARARGRGGGERKRRVAALKNIHGCTAFFSSTLSRAVSGGVRGALGPGGGGRGF